MKIAFIGGRNIHELGGIESYMKNLCTELVKLGYQPVVYCESDHKGIEWVNGFKVIHWKSPKSASLSKIYLGLKSTLHALFRERGIKVIHYNAWGPSLFHWLAIGKPTILMGHGMEWKRTKYSPLQRKIMKWMEAFTAKTNRHLLMCSEEQTLFFAKEYGRTCVTMPTAVYMPTGELIESEILNKYGLAYNRYFLYLGRLVQDKNPNFLIKAFNESEIKSMKLVIAGSNDKQPEYVKSLHNLAKDNPNIIFTGAVYGHDKECLLKNCAVFCIPSTIEGLAITLLEAMSYGKPVIASDIEANREGLGENGLWVKAEDVKSLREQLQNCEQHLLNIVKSGEINKDRVKRQFTWEAISHRYDEYIKGLVK